MTEKEPEQEETTDIHSKLGFAMSALRWVTNAVKRVQGHADIKARMRLLQIMLSDDFRGEQWLERQQGAYPLLLNGNGKGEMCAGFFRTCVPRTVDESISFLSQYGFLFADNRELDAAIVQHPSAFRCGPVYAQDHVSPGFVWRAWINKKGTAQTPHIATDLERRGPSQQSVIPVGAWLLGVRR